MAIGIDFATAAESTFTGFGDNGGTYRLCMTDVTIGRKDEVLDVTQQGDTQDDYVLSDGTVLNGTAADKVTVSAFAGTSRYEYGISGRGFFQVDNAGTWEFQRAQGTATAVTGATHSRVSRIRLSRNIELIDVTASQTALPEREYAFGRFTYSFSTDGYLLSTETPMSDEHNPDTPTTLSLPFGTGTISGGAIWRAIDQGMAFNRGGPHSIRSEGIFTGVVTTGTTPFQIAEWAVTADLDNGQTFSGDAVITRLTADLDYRTGGPIVFSFQGVVSGGSAA